MSKDEKPSQSVTPEQVVDAARKVAKKSDEAFLFLVGSVARTAVRIVSETVTVGRAAKKAADVSASFTRMGVGAVRKQLKDLSEGSSKGKAESEPEEEGSGDLLDEGAGQDEPSSEEKVENAESSPSEADETEQHEEPDEEPDEEPKASALAALTAAAAEGGDDDEGPNGDDDKAPTKEEEGEAPSDKDGVGEE